MSPARVPLGSSFLSRRQWLKSTGLLAGGSLALPAVLPALGPDAPHDGTLDALHDPAALVRDGLTTPEGFLAHERAVVAARAAAGPVRLASNENPYGMAPSARAALMEHWDEHNKYGNASPNALRARFAESVGVPAECVLVTAGSNEVLSLAALAFGIGGGEIVSPWPTFEQVPRYGDVIGARVHRVPLDAGHAHDLPAMAAKMGQATSLVFVCNPNNPTGTLTNAARLRDFVTSAARRTTVLVDEAYHDFVDDPSYRSMMDLVTSGANVLISRTASKIHGLAGLRTGFAVGRADLIARMERFQTSAPGVFGARAAIASIGDVAYQDMCRQRNREGRQVMESALTALRRPFTASHTNFVFFDAGMPVEEVQRRMLARGFQIGRAFPPYATWARISIGTPPEMQQVAQALPAVLAG